MRFVRAALAATVSIACLAGVAAQAAGEPPTIAISLKAHRFTPSTFSVPAGQKVRVVLTNFDTATEEFDSHDLKVEQLVTPNGRASFTIGPLKPGTYSFMGEFHADTAQGRVTVAEAGR